MIHQLLTPEEAANALADYAMKKANVPFIAGKPKAQIRTVTVNDRLQIVEVWIWDSSTEDAPA